MPLRPGSWKPRRAKKGSTRSRGPWNTTWPARGRAHSSVTQSGASGSSEKPASLGIHVGRCVRAASRRGLLWSWRLMARASIGGSSQHQSKKLPELERLLSRPAAHSTAKEREEDGSRHVLFGQSMAMVPLILRALDAPAAKKVGSSSFQSRMHCSRKYCAHECRTTQRGESCKAAR